MKNRIVGFGLALVASVMVTTALVQGQTQERILTAQVQQTFTAGNRTFAPGEYEILRMAAGTFVVRSVTGGESASVPVVTRLAQTGPKDAPPKLVFDKLPNGDSLLSEIWLTNEDGYLVCTMQKEHQHGIVPAKIK